VFIVLAPWNTVFLDEMELFPTKGAHDDIPDSTSGSFAVLSGRMPHGNIQVLHGARPR
jgi:phage terminase large subunit-like protein